MVSYITNMSERPPSTYSLTSGKCHLGVGPYLQDVVSENDRCQDIVTVIDSTY